MGPIVGSRRPGNQLSQVLRVAVICAIVICLLTYSYWIRSLLGSSSVQIQEQPRSVAARSIPPEWQVHHIFEGNVSGKLDGCPEWPAALQLWQGHAPRAPQQQQHNRQGSVLPFTLQALQTVWKHQHPQDCSKAKFLMLAHKTFPKRGYGVGSIIHLTTTMLRAALDSGRVLVEEPGHFLTNDTYCRGQGLNTLDSCYFVPLSNCSLTVEQIAGATEPDGDEAVAYISSQDPNLPQVFRVHAEGHYWLYQERPHSLFKQELSSTAIPEGWNPEVKNRMYWWRAIGAAYLMRPNARTYAQLAARRRAKLRGPRPAPGCIGTYIRHGDKGTESGVYSDAQYEAALEKLRSIDSSLTNQLFLSTEDPVTVGYFTRSGAWATSFVDMPRKPDTSKSNMEYMEEHGYANELLDSLLNLELTMECDAFVGSIFSNWARLIDELRSTVWCKADRIYYDVHYQAPKGLDYGV